MNPIALVAIDPSSTRTGYAAFTARGALVDALALTPDRTRDGPLQRTQAMISAMLALVREAEPGEIVIEIPSGRPGKGSGAGARASLAIYGLAAGAAWWALVDLVGTMEDRGRRVVLIPVTEQEWTGRRPKRRRQRAIEREVVGYDNTRDRGADVADAIGLGLWRLKSKRMQAMSGARG